MSSDEGEIVEATPQPRFNGNGNVDRTGRNQGGFSRTPEPDNWSRNSADVSNRRSRSPRGLKRPRDDREHAAATRPDQGGRDPRRFRVRYETDGSRDDTRRERRRYEDLDRPPSRGSQRDDDGDYRHPPSRFANRDSAPGRSSDFRRNGRDRSRDFDRSYDGHLDKKWPRNRSRSPKGRRDRGRRERGRFQRSQNIDHAESIKYSAQNDKRSRGSPGPRRGTALEEAPDTSRHHAKYHQGASGERNAEEEATSTSTR